jgi:hypothetical protein
MSNIIVGGYPSGGFYTQDDIRGYKVYTALLTQNGTNPPVATVLENTLGFEPIWEYASQGNYDCVSSNQWTQDKTIVFITQSDENASGITGAYLWNANSIVRIYTRDFDGVGLNGVLAKTSIQIRIYP